MYDIAYDRPTSLVAALEALADPESWPLAGGMTLLPSLKMRLARPSRVIDLDGIADLRGIAVTPGTVRIGAMVRHAEVAASADVRAAIPALAELAAGIGDPQVRHRGTIGGSVANHDPAADYPAAVLGLGATVHTTAGDIAADGFFEGMFGTALPQGALITAISFPRPAAAVYAKFPQPASRYALVGAFVARDAAGAVRVAITGAGPGVFRSPAHEAALAASFTPAAAEAARIPADMLTSDVHGSAAYRAHLVSVMVARAVADAEDRR